MASEHRHQTKYPGIFRVVLADGDERFIATWKEPWSDPAHHPIASRRSREQRAQTIDEARVIQLEGQIAAKEASFAGHPGVRDPVEVLTDNCTVEQWVNAIESTKRRRSVSSAKRDGSILRNHVYPALGNLKLGQLRRRQHIEPWVTDLSVTLAPSTVARAKQLVSAAMEAAIDEGILSRNPCRGVELPPERDKEVESLTVDEIHALAAAIDPRFRAMVYVSGFTGLRIGEVSALTLPKVDLAEGSLRVEFTMKDGVLKEPKTASSRRTVALSPFVVEDLARHTTTYPPGDDDLIFTMPGGGPIHMTNLRRRYWHPACEEALGRRVGFHSLRHGHTVQLQEARIDPKVIMARLGHKSLAVTYSTYAHSTGDMDREAARALDGMIRPDSGTAD